RARAPALVREQREEDRGGVVDVGAPRRRHPFRDPEETEQAHHMVEADAGAVARRTADRVDEGFPVRGAELPRVERWKSPVLAVAEELVGRRADAHARREVVLPSPAVEAVRSEADRDIRDETDLA